jgi:hypothetical protein
MLDTSIRRQAPGGSLLRQVSANRFTNG